MNEVNTTALSERVKRLERQNKLIKLTGIAVILGMAFMLLVGAKEKVPKEIVAESFRVVDTQGRIRAVLFVDQEGPALGLLDERGKLRATIAIDQEGPLLGLYDKREKTRAELAILQIGPRLSLSDENGKIRAGLAVIPEGPALALSDKYGKTKVITP